MNAGMCSLVDALKSPVSKPNPYKKNNNYKKDKRG